MSQGRVTPRWTGETALAGLPTLAFNLPWHGSRQAGPFGAVPFGAGLAPSVWISFLQLRED